MSAKIYHHDFRPGIYGAQNGALRLPRATVPTETGTTSRLNGMYVFKPYVYGGTGRDTLTAWMDDEDAETERLTRRQERLEMFATLKLAGLNNGNPDDGITAQQAAEILGVTTRTIERYKRELARQA